MLTLKKGITLLNEFRGFRKFVLEIGRGFNFPEAISMVLSFEGENSTFLKQFRAFKNFEVEVHWGFNFLKPISKDSKVLGVKVDQ